MVFVFVLSVFVFVLSSGVRMVTVFILSSFPRVFFPIFPKFVLSSCPSLYMCVPCSIQMHMYMNKTKDQNL